MDEHLKQAIVEATESSDIVNVEKLEAELNKIAKRDSIVQRVADVQKISGPTGRLNGIIRDPVTDSLIVTTELVDVTSRKIKTEFTQEAMKDLESLYGEDMYNVLAHYLNDELSYELDKDFLSMINDAAKVEKEVVFSGAIYDTQMGEARAKLFVKLAKVRANLAKSSKKPMNNFAVVSTGTAALLLGSELVAIAVDEGVSRVSYLGTFAGIDIYLDSVYDSALHNNKDYCTIGVKGNGRSSGSVILAPYNKSFLTATDSASGELRYFLLDRTAMITNPSDIKGTGNSVFLTRFEVDVSTLDIFTV